MKSYNNELVVNRNESFTMTKTLYNKDGSPYIISSEIDNPYWLISVSNSRYEQSDRYMFRKWLNLSDYPKFRQTVPLNRDDIKNGVGQPAYDSWPTQESVYNNGEGKVLYYIFTGYINDVLVYLEKGDCVYYTTDIYGNKTYVYPDVDDEHNITWKQYSCYIITTFTSDITSEWIEQTYYYAIQLVGGELKENYDDESTDFIFETPLSLDIPILEPTKMKVSSNIEGGL